MKKFFLLLGVLAFFISCTQDIPIVTENPPVIVPALSGTDYIYDIEKVPVVYISVSTQEWNNFLSYYDQNPNNEEYVLSDFVFVKDEKRDTLLSCGLRLRGNTSRRRPEGFTGQVHSSVNPDWHHASFSVKFNKYVKGQKLEGQKKVNLKWFKDDGDYAREIYCYDLFKRFGVWTAPKSSYCRLFLKIKEDNRWINYGVYELLEPVDEDFLKNRADSFPDTKGNLWKANWGADLSNPAQARMDIENITLTSTYSPVYDLKTNEDKLNEARNQLTNFINNLNSKSGDDFVNWLESTMDVPLFLKTYAVNVMCGMWDDYWNNSNNFYFYFDSNNKFYFIPFDYDNTLGTSLLMDDSGTHDLLNWGSNTNPLVKKIISIDKYKAMYVNYLNELCNANNDLFYYTKSMSRIVNWQNMIRNYVTNDTGEDMSIVDVPASWGNQSKYRLLSSTNNYFIIRSQNLPK